LTTAIKVSIVLPFNTSDVTIDLNGHTLYGPGHELVLEASGIYSNVGDNITITNGAIRNFISAMVLNYKWRKRILAK
jgi:hypothetical protein